MEATPPVSAMLNPTLIGSAALARRNGQAADTAAAVAINERLVMIIRSSLLCLSLRPLTPTLSPAVRGRDPARSDGRVRGNLPSAAILDEAVPHFAESFDLSLHHIADSEECVRALT